MIASNKRMNEIEKVLIQNILNGNTNDFAILVERYKQRVFNLAYRFAGNGEDANDLAQDIFIKVFRSLSGFRADSSLSTWMYRISLNHLISLKRKKVIDTTSISNYDQNDCKEENESNAELEENMKLLERALEKLDSLDRILIDLYYYEDQKVEDIAKILDLSESNVKVKIFRIRRKLGEWIEFFREREFYREQYEGKTYS